MWKTGIMSYAGNRQRVLQISQVSQENKAKAQAGALMQEVGINQSQKQKAGTSHGQ